MIGICVFVGERWLDGYVSALDRGVEGTFSVVVIL